MVRVNGFSALGSQAKATLVNSNQKSGLLASPTVVLSKVHIGAQPWEVGRLLIRRGTGEVMYDLLMTPWTVI